MFELQTILADHKDVIHDVAYDFYGQRMATCSSDQTVKVNKVASAFEVIFTNDSLSRKSLFRYGTRLKKKNGQ